MSLVNLAMALGIGVEFNAHVLHAFLVAPGPSRAARAGAALRAVGASVLSGITLTKLAGAHSAHVITRLACQPTHPGDCYSSALREAAWLYMM